MLRKLRSDVCQRGFHSPGLFHARENTGGFDISDVGGGPGTTRIDIIHKGGSGGISILSVKPHNSDAPLIYIVKNGAATFDRALTEVASDPL